MSLFTWIKDCVNYYVFGQAKEELITKISDTTNNISPIVKENLLKSIMQDNPNQFIEQLNNETNNIPALLKEDLLSSMVNVDHNMRASSMYAHPISAHQIVQPKKTIVCNYIERDWKKVYKRVMGQLKLKHLMKTRKETDYTLACLIAEDTLMQHQYEHTNQLYEIPTIHTGKIIPSEQFVSKSIDRIVTRKPVVKHNNANKNWKKTFNLVLNQLKLKQFIKERKQTVKAINEAEKIRNTFQSVMTVIKMRNTINELQQKRSMHNITMMLGKASDTIREMPTKQIKNKKEFHHKHCWESNGKNIRFTPNKFVKRGSPTQRYQILRMERKWNQHY